MASQLCTIRHQQMIATPDRITIRIEQKFSCIAIGDGGTAFIGDDLSIGQNNWRAGVEVDACSIAEVPDVFLFLCRSKLRKKESKQKNPQQKAMSGSARIE